MKLALRVSLLCVIATPLAARHAVVNVSGGETLETISQRYYGNAGLAASLRTHNSLPGEPTAGRDPTPTKPPSSVTPSATRSRTPVARR